MEGCGDTFRLVYAVTVTCWDMEFSRLRCDPRGFAGHGEVDGAATDGYVFFGSAVIMIWYGEVEVFGQLCGCPTRG